LCLAELLLDKGSICKFISLKLQNERLKHWEHKVNLLHKWWNIECNLE
jgi:hypothetical protein